MNIEWSAIIKLLPLFLLALTACAPGRETQASRDYLNCVYEAQYGYSGLNDVQRLAAKERCKK